ncbi:MAG: hypothetical protein V7609_2417 [Verrucomicrobiota bacterium]
MMIKIAACLLAVTFLASCETTRTTQRTTLREMNSARLASNDTSSNLNEPAPPAEGPEDVPAEGPLDPNRNPALLPSPLLRVNAARSP